MFNMHICCKVFYDRGGLKPEQKKDVAYLSCLTINVRVAVLSQQEMPLVDCVISTNAIFSSFTHRSVLFVSDHSSLRMIRDNE
jgi:hypothetical protein